MKGVYKCCQKILNMVFKKLAAYFRKSRKPEEKKLYLHVDGIPTTWRAESEYLGFVGGKPGGIIFRRDEDCRPMDLPLGTYVAYAEDGTRVNYVGDEEFGSWILMCRPYVPPNMLSRLFRRRSRNSA